MTAKGYECPLCGSAVYAWVEQVIEHRSIVDPKTGRFTKARKVSIGNATECRGVKCSNAQCDWRTYVGDIPDQYFEGIAGKGFDALYELADQVEP